MTAQYLSSELTTLISESKRKQPDIRNAAEKSLSELKALPSTSEAQLAADLSRRPQFIEPLLLSCASKHVKIAAIGTGCLQRVTVIRGLPKARLREVLEAIRECCALSQDIQLKILQTLPSILQNYAEDVRGSLLFSLLQTCSILFSSKTAVVSSTAAATFQQVLSSLFEELSREDQRSLEVPTSAEVPGLDDPVQVRPVAFDAVRVLQDLCLIAEGNKPVTVRLSPLPEPSSLELVETILSSYSDAVSAHSELAFVVKNTLLPYLLQSFREKKKPFPLTVRVCRLLYMVVRNHIELFPHESMQILESFNNVIDENESQAGWKRIICLEIYRGIFMEPQLVLRIYSACDERDRSHSIIRTCMASFVRLASEKPALIGLGQHSTLPVGNYFQRETGNDSSGDLASGASKAEGTAGVGTLAVPGISNQYSAVRTPLIDQLDKTDTPHIPDTYAYSLVLLCLNNLAESLAKFILPLTVQHGAKAKRRPRQTSGQDEDAPQVSEKLSSQTVAASTDIRRTPSLRRRNVPVNPLSLVDHPKFNDIETAADLIDKCWPAILASCSTFFYAALDSDHYRALVRSFQKFAQVAGLLRMSTPRDAFLTTLGKAAVPAHVAAATLASPSSPSPQSPSLLRSATGLLNVETLVNQASTLMPDRGRRTSLDASDSGLSSRNLLCLRALLNLAIALGPTLEKSWSIIFETLQQADKVMLAINMRPATRDSRSSGQTPTVFQGEFTPNSNQTISSEVAAIQAAASRLFESTADFPNESFISLLEALCFFLGPTDKEFNQAKSPPPTPDVLHKRVSSFAGAVTTSDTTEKDFVFALSKIRELVSANIERFVAYQPHESGWEVFTSIITSVAVGHQNPSTARMLAAELLSRLTRDLIVGVVDFHENKHAEVHLRSLSAISSLCTSLDNPDRISAEADDTTNEIHLIALDTLRAIVEQIGDNLSQGWELVFRIIGSSFYAQARTQDVTESRQTLAFAELKTINLGRLAFSSTQLICSDFLSTVPDDSLLTLVDTIYGFARQRSDLNMSLTATTLFWNLSDLFSSHSATEALDELAVKADRVKDEKELLYSNESPSHTMLWLTLLSRVRDIAADPREEVRTGAVSTLIRIFDNHGDGWTTKSWHMLLRIILLPLIETDVDDFPRELGAVEPTELKRRLTTSKLILEGISKLLTDYIDTIVTSDKFLKIWARLMNSLNAYDKCGQYDLSQVVFATITTLLKNIPSLSKIGQAAVDDVNRIWAEDIPNSAYSSLSGTNQDVYLSYIYAFREIYRLNAHSFTPTAITSIVKNFRQVIWTSEASPYTSDIDSMTTLQREVLQGLSLVRTDQEGAPSAIIVLLADFVSLPLADHQTYKQKSRPTFIAFAKATMDAAVAFATAHIERREIFRQALLLLLKALEQPIALKYAWKTQGKDPSLWGKATSCALVLIELLVPRLSSCGLSPAEVESYWEIIVRIGRGIATADVEEANDDQPIFDDEDFDIKSLSRYSQIIVPSLGSDSVPEHSRRTFARALLDNSILHKTEPHDLPDLNQEPLRDLYQVRFGRTYDPQPVLRGSMSYHCLADLIALVARQDSSSERVRLARAAAPYIILRAATTLKLYIADHPLRGRFMPLPSSQREEMLFILRSIRELESEPKAIPETDGIQSLTKRHLIRLYPLVVRAIEVEGRRAKPDEAMLGEMRAVLEAVGNEFML